MKRRHQGNGLRSLLLLLTLLLTALASALASAQYMFKTLGTREGLTSSRINCILKDSKGYMWFGTPAGLYRYDGYTFRKFQRELQNGATLPDSYIKSIQEAFDGELWIETAAGFAVYHQQNEAFDADMNSAFNRIGIRETPTLFHIDKDKRMWMYFPKKGIYCFNSSQQQSHEFYYDSMEESSIPDGDIVAIGECSAGALLLYQNGTMVCCQIKDGKASVAWKDKELAERGLRMNKTLKIFTDMRDNIWIYGQGLLYLYDKNKRTWHTDFAERVGLRSGNTDHSVNSMAYDKRGNIWIATDQNGLLRLSTTDMQVEQVNPVSINDRQPLKSISIQSVYVDNTDLLWVGTEKQGAAFWSEDIYKFESELCGDISAITQDEQGHVWLGTSDNGIVGSSAPLTSKKITALATTPDGSLWVGTQKNGLTRIKDGTSTFYTTAKDSGRTVIDDRINALTTDRTGNLWIATEGGLQVYNVRMNTFSNYTNENGKLKTNYITSLYYANGNKILAGSPEGLVTIMLSSNEFTFLTGTSDNLKSFTNYYVTQVFEDSRGLIWVGTRDGLNVLNPEKDDLDIISEKEGLCNNNICGITEDKEKNIWVTTGNGVARIHVQRNHTDAKYIFGINNYTTADGLQSSEFNNGAILTRKDGSVLLGGLYGINWVKKDSGKEQHGENNVMLTQLFIGEEEVMCGKFINGTIPIPLALNESHRIVLTREQNTFTIKFASSNYNQSEHSQFVYWLEGHDPGWKSANPLIHGMTFTNLESGTYTLHVKASSANGKASQNQEERILEIVIKSPWWASKWMIAVYALLVLLAFLAWKYGFRKIVKVWEEKRAVIDQLKIQRSEIREASDELRQPMARIASIIGNLAMKTSTVEEREQLNALNGQVLQLITRLSDMQTKLENPEKKAKEKVKVEVDNVGMVKLPKVARTELTSEMSGGLHADLPTTRFMMVIIDDNKDFLSFIASQLNHIYTLVLYDNIMKASEELEDLRANIVLCKQDMKGMKGSDLCNKLKSNMATQNTKFVLMTDSLMGLNDIRSQGLTLAADDCLAKPFKINVAIQRFNKLLGATAEEVMLIEGNSASTRQDSQQNASRHLENKQAVSTETASPQMTSTETASPTAGEQPLLIGDDTEIDLEGIAAMQMCQQSASEQTSPDIPQGEMSTTPNLPQGEETSTSNLPQEKKNSTSSLQQGEEGQTGEIKPVVMNNSGEGLSMRDEMNIMIDDNTDINDVFSIQDSIDNQLLYNIEQYVTQNMSRGNISLEKLAAAMGMGRVPFFHKIRNLTGMTPAELVRDIRLKTACDMLATQETNINEIALRLGFATAENFITVFRAKYKMTPSEYRMKYHIH